MSAAVNLDELRDRRDQLEARLLDGYRRIGEAEAAGKDFQKWEEFWLTLLKEYESICDELLGQA